MRDRLQHLAGIRNGCSNSVRQLFRNSRFERFAGADKWHRRDGIEARTMTHAAADLHGLLWAFELAPVTVRDQELLEARATDRPQWLHFSLVDTRACRWIENAGLDDEAREGLLEPAAHSHSQHVRDKRA